MARSILPSRARKSARFKKRALQHKNRSEIRDKIYHLRGYASDVIDNYEEDGYDLEHHWTPRYMPGWDHIVYDRREADHLNHFVRWVERKVEGMGEGRERWDYIKSLVPEGFMGEHALTHLWMFKPNENNYLATRYTPRNREQIAKIEAINDLMLKNLGEIMANPKRAKKWNHIFYHWVKSKNSPWKLDIEFGKGKKYPYEFFEWTQDNYVNMFNRMARITYTGGFYWVFLDDDKEADSLNVKKSDLTDFVSTYTHVELPDEIKAR